MTNQSADEKLQGFLMKYPTRDYKKGEIILFQGEAPRSAYVVKDGTVKTYNLSVSGDEKPIAFHNSLDVFPSAWVFGHLPSAVYYYEAFSPEVSIYIVNREDYVDFINKNPDILRREFEQLLTLSIGQGARLNALQYSRASDKLLYTLHFLAVAYGNQISPNEIEIPLALTHQDFANLTGLTRETAATELNKLKSNKVISYGKKTYYHLNLDKLMSTLNDDYLNELHIKL